MRKTAIATLIVAMAGAGAASAGTQQQYPTIFTKFKYKGGESFSGKIGSNKPGCIDGRKVVLFRKNDKLGKSKTNENGKFKIELSGGLPQDGKYYAKVKQDTIGNGIVCLKRESGSVKITTS